MIYETSHIIQKWITFHQFHPLSGSVHILYCVPCKQLSFPSEILNAGPCQKHYTKPCKQVNHVNVKIKEHTMNA